MSTAPFQTGPETTYDPQAQSMSQTKLPIVRQEELAAAASSSNGGDEGTGMESNVARKVEQVRDEGLGENEKFKRPEDQAK
jgi:hypothetical protein